MPDPTVQQHRLRLAEAVVPLPPVVVPATEARGRVLAADAVGALAVPPFDGSAMDGFAVRSADVADAPVELPVVAVVAAGDPVATLPPGAAIRIMTGAPVPVGADLVVPFEQTTGTDPVRVLEPAAAGRHIRREGEDVPAGAVALPAGTRLGPAQLGLLASVGCAEVTVRARPRVGIVSTGAELVSGAVPDSNSVVLAAAAADLGADVRRFGPAPDEPDAFLEVVLGAAEECDLVVTTGGVSAGDHDVVKLALRDRPGFWFGAVAMRPGRPQGFGVLRAGGRDVPVLCLPGNPPAAYASFLLYGRDAVVRLAGGVPAPRSAPLATDVTATERTVLLPGTYDESGRVAPLPGHAGHSQGLLARAEALLVVPPSGRVIPAGEAIEVLALRPEEDR